MPLAVGRRQLAAVAVERHMRDLPGDLLQPLLLETLRPMLRLHRDRGWADTGLTAFAEAGLMNLPRGACAGRSERPFLGRRLLRRNHQRLALHVHQEDRAPGQTAGCSPGDAGRPPAPRLVHLHGWVGDGGSGERRKRISLLSSHLQGRHGTATAARARGPLLHIWLPQRDGSIGCSPRLRPAQSRRARCKRGADLHQCPRIGFTPGFGLEIMSENHQNSIRKSALNKGITMRILTYFSTF